MNKAPIFQHQHYKAIAAMLFDTAMDANSGPGRHATLSALRDRMADAFERDNPLFNRERFLAATAGAPRNGRDKVRS